MPPDCELSFLIKKIFSPPVDCVSSYAIYSSATLHHSLHWNLGECENLIFEISRFVKFSSNFAKDEIKIWAKFSHLREKRNLNFGTILQIINGFLYYQCKNNRKITKEIGTTTKK